MIALRRIHSKDVYVVFYSETGKRMMPVIAPHYENTEHPAESR